MSTRQRRVPSVRASRDAVPGLQVGRFSPGQRWTQAIAAIAELVGSEDPLACRARRNGAVLWRDRARFRSGAAVVNWYEPVADAGGIVRALTETDGAPIVHLRRFLPDQVVTRCGCGGDRGARRLRARAVRAGRPRDHGRRWRRHGRIDPARSTPARTATPIVVETGRPGRDRQRAPRSRRATGARGAAPRLRSPGRRRLCMADRHRRPARASAVHVSCTSAWCLPSPEHRHARNSWRGTV